MKFPSIVATALIALIGTAAVAQSLDQHGVAPSPYAGEEQRLIKALSPSDIDALVQGKGAGYAKAAELNGYPGPAHVLELAEPLLLSPEQRQQTQALMQRHRGQAQALGAAIVQAERELDAVFARRQASAAQVDAKTADVARLQGQLRAEHLKTHVDQTALLTEAQVRLYGQLRGYAVDEPSMRSQNPRSGEQAPMNHLH